MDSTNHMLKLEINYHGTISRLGHGQKLSHEMVNMSSIEPSQVEHFGDLDDQVLDEEISVNHVPWFDSKFDFAHIKGGKLHPDDNKIMQY